MMKPDMFATRWAAPPIVRCTGVVTLLLASLFTGRVEAGSVARYRVRMDEGAPRLFVTAQVPIAGSKLQMSSTRPAGIPELDSLGWAGLVKGLKVVDARGGDQPLSRAGEAGWRLAEADTGLLTLEYEVDYGPLERMNWPAAREAVYREAEYMTLVGRSLFVTTRETSECEVTFELPRGWRATTPWRGGSKSGSYAAGGVDDLTENLLVFSRGGHDHISASGFEVDVFALGRWSEAREPILRFLTPVVRHHVRFMGDTSKRSYVVVLLPELEDGGESYRSSFALNSEDERVLAVAPKWGNLIAHEMFHLWNGWTLRGADYSSTQWFQEGFTEYVANLAVASSGQVDAGWLREKLATHIENSRRLTTTLENIGTKKGAPLYSAGALVAFSWDMRIRGLTNGRRDLGDFFRELLRQTQGGADAYAWPTLRAALEATAPGDWEGYYHSHIRGDQPLPIAEALASVGQRVVEVDGVVRVEGDPSAGSAAQTRWAELSRAR